MAPEPVSDGDEPTRAFRRVRRTRGIAFRTTASILVFGGLVGGIAAVGSAKLIEHKEHRRLNDALVESMAAVQRTASVAAYARDEQLAAVLAARQGIGVDTGRTHAVLQVVGPDAAEHRRIHNVCGSVGNDHRLVARVSHGFAGGDEARTHVAEIGAQHFGGAQAAPVRQGARQDQRAAPELAHFRDQGEG